MHIIIANLRDKLKIGLYGADNGLFKTLSFEGRTFSTLTDALLTLKSEINIYEIDSIVYALGPGSLTATKLTSIFANTLFFSISARGKSVELLGVDSFYFNNNAPILAFNNMYFIREGASISLVPLALDAPSSEVELPSIFDISHFSGDCAPIYVVPSV